jgi:hypothetical protein
VANNLDQREVVGDVPKVASSLDQLAVAPTADCTQDQRAGELAPKVESSRDRLADEPTEASSRGQRAAAPMAGCSQDRPGRSDRRERQLE